MHIKHNNQTDLCYITVSPFFMVLLCFIIFLSIFRNLKGWVGSHPHNPLLIHQCHEIYNFGRRSLAHHEDRLCKKVEKMILKK